MLSTKSSKAQSGKNSDDVTHKPVGSTPRTLRTEFKGHNYLLCECEIFCRVNKFHIAGNNTGVTSWT